MEDVPAGPMNLHIIFNSPTQQTVFFILRKK